MKKITSILTILILTGCSTYELTYIGTPQGDDCAYYFTYKTVEYSVVDTCGAYEYGDKLTPTQFKKLDK